MLLALLAPLLQVPLVMDSASSEDPVAAAVLLTMNGRIAIALLRVVVVVEVADNDPSDGLGGWTIVVGTTVRRDDDEYNDESTADEDEDTSIIEESVAEVTVQALVAAIAFVVLRIKWKPCWYCDEYCDEIKGPAGWK